MLLKQTVLFYFADRTQMAGESLFFSNFWIAAHALSPRQKGKVRTACGHRARLGLDKQQSQKTPSVSTLLLSVWLQRISSYRFSWVKTNFCVAINQAKPVPSWPVGLQDLSASLISSAGPLGRTFVLGKVERGSNSPAGFPGPGWCNPSDFSTEEIRGGCHRKKLWSPTWYACSHFYSIECNTWWKAGILWEAQSWLNGRSPTVLSVELVTVLGKIPLAPLVANGWKMQAVLSPPVVLLQVF